MKISLQPKKSTTCGHHCVAMIADVPVKRVIIKIGHVNGTWTKELVKALNYFGIKTGTERLVIIKEGDKLPDLCILKMRFNHDVKGNWHWVVYNNGDIYCPSDGVYKYSPLRFAMMGVNISSYIEILKDEQ